MTHKTYNIPFTDSSKVGIVLNSAIGFEDIDHSTSMALVAPGADGWGDAVDANFLHLLESHASPYAPHKPVIGQIWYKTYEYQCVLSHGSTRWYNWDRSLFAWKDITNATFAVGALAAVPSGTPDMQYMYYVGTSSVYENNSLYVWLGGHWELAAFNRTTAAPSNVQPIKTMMVWDGATWLSCTGTSTGSVAPSGKAGQLWYDDSTSQLKMWNATSNSWENLLTANGTSALVADFSVGTASHPNRVVNVKDVLELATPATKARVLERRDYVAAEHSTVVAHQQNANIHLSADEHKTINSIRTSAYQINSLRGVAPSTVVDLLAQAKLGTMSTESGVIELTGGEMVGNLSIAHSVTNNEHVATKEYVDTLTRVEMLSDVIVPATGFKDGDVLIYDSALRMWKPRPTANQLFAVVVTKTVNAGGTTGVIAAMYDASTHKTVDVTRQVTWTVPAGQGNVVGSSYTAHSPTSPCVVTLRATYTYAGVQYTAEVSVQVAAADRIQSVVIQGPSSFVAGDRSVQYLAVANYYSGRVRTVSSDGRWRVNGNINVDLHTLLPGQHTVEVEVVEGAVTVTDSVVVTCVPATIAMEIVGPSKLERGDSYQYACIQTSADGTKSVVVPDLWMCSQGTVTPSGVYNSPTNLVQGSSQVSIEARIGEVTVRRSVVILPSHTAAWPNPAPSAVPIDGIRKAYAVVGASGSLARGSMVWVKCLVHGTDNTYRWADVEGVGTQLEYATYDSALGYMTTRAAYPPVNDVVTVRTLVDGSTPYSGGEVLEFTPLPDGGAVGDITIISKNIGAPVVAPLTPITAAADTPLCVWIESDSQVLVVRPAGNGDPLTLRSKTIRASETVEAVNGAFSFSYLKQGTLHIGLPIGVSVTSTANTVTLSASYSAVDVDVDVIYAHLRVEHDGGLYTYSGYELRLIVG